MRKIEAIVLLGAGLAGIGIVGCQQVPGGGTMPGVPGAGGLGGCGAMVDLNAGTVGDFGTGAAAMKVEGFLKAAVAVHRAAIQVETDLAAACTAIGTDLGVPAAQMQPAGNEPGARAKAACTAASGAIEAAIRTNMPRGVKFRLVYQPPVCTADMNVAAQAAAECDANVQANAQVQCEGKLAGRCTGECTGSCSGKCTGSCSGDCTGTCGGTCNGTCEGRCAGRAAPAGGSGECNGRCDGTCTGSCSARCEGTCSADCSGSCDAECSGSCSVEFQEPHCEGNANVQASAECKASAEVRASAEVHCTEPRITFGYTRPVPPEAQARLRAVVTTLQANFPKILVAVKRLQVSLVPSVQAFARVSTDFVATMPNLMGELGAQAMAAGDCVRGAAQGVAAASGSVNVSMEVSVQASASASAEGSAGT